MVEQLGLAMIPLCFLISSGLTSGTTKGTSGSIRNCEVLSITTAPALAAIGAHILEISAPGEDKTMSTPLNTSLVNGTYLLPSNTPPAPLGEININLLTGNLRSLTMRYMHWPTAPRIPKMATLYFFILKIPQPNPRLLR